MAGTTVGGGADDRADRFSSTHRDRGRAIRNRVITRHVAVVLIALVVWFVTRKAEAKGQLTAAKWEPFLTANLWKTYILPGVQGTLTAAAVSIVLALVLGFVLGVGRLSHTSAIRWRVRRSWSSSAPCPC